MAHKEDDNNQIVDEIASTKQNDRRACVANQQAPRPNPMIIQAITNN